MLKISALNDDSSDEESENEEEKKEELTKEALEEIAMQQYGKTLELQRRGKYQDALNLLKDLLDTELLYDVKKIEGQDAANVSPLLKLKYLCYKNIAVISAELGDKQSSVNAYLEASYLDDTDITLWYRLGKLCMDLSKFDLALFAFQRGIECNSRHWPCLDYLITLLLGLGSYNECIATIYEALQIDNDYLRGRVYRKYIFTNYPHVLNYMAMLNPMYKWSKCDDEDIVGEEYEKLINEALKINETFILQVMESNVPSKLPVLSLNKRIKNLTWLSVGESIVDMHKYISENSLSHACIVTVAQPVVQMEVENAPQLMDGDVSLAKQLSGDLNEISQLGDLKQGDEKVDGNEADKQMDVDQEVGNQTQESSKAAGDNKDPKKASRRRGSSVRFLQQWEWCNKRKSSRKKSSKPEQETLYGVLRRLLPNHLKNEENGQEDNSKNKEFRGDDSMDTMDLYKLFEEKEKNAVESSSEENKEESNEVYFNTDNEQTEVRAFVQKYAESSCDIISMVDEFVLILSKYWDIQWPEGLRDVYMTANNCSKQHSDPPLSYCLEENVLKDYVRINVLHLEVELNKLLEEECQNWDINLELLDLLRIFCSRSNELGDEALTLTLRYLWVKCHSLLYKRQVEFALDSLHYIIEKLCNLEDEGNGFTLRVVNFSKWPTITKSNCIELIRSLERNKELSAVPRLFQSGRYEEAINILQDSFKHCQALAAKQDWKGISLDWGVQLVTLLEAIWATNNTEQCFIWATTCLREALKQYMLCEQGSHDYEKWSLVVVKALACIQHILKTEGCSYLDVLPERNLIQMIQDIIQIIIHQLDDSNISQEMPLNTVSCWVILHYVFQREEDCGRMLKKDSTTQQVDTEMPISLVILFMAHENLGRKGWCTKDENQLLYFTLKTVMCRLRSPALSGVVETVSQYLEQCVLCLFGHPSKKAKLRYLTDHNATPTKLDWEWAQLIFDLYRSEELPEFNSNRLASISGDTEQLFQTILSLAPPGMMDPHHHYSDVVAFIEGKKTKLHHFNVQVPFKMRDIFYLLADYYLKNYETVKALKYYAYDIVVCRKRFDSWAGMALAKGSLLEIKLNSCESFRNEMEYLNRATAVEFCYKQALDIDSSHSMLWIEYGTFVYGVHSFCSRLLKQASESLSMENFEVLENKKDAMLDTASKCFVKAHRQWMEECQGNDKGPQDERWLHYYMLGKISEKKGEPPMKYLDYYQKAASFLQENNATYPSKINYSNPQNLSVEALEIHYRIHASVLKYIEQHENKTICIKVGKCFKECLDKTASGPFFRKKISKDFSDSKDPNVDEKTESEINLADANTVEDVSLKRSNSEIGDNIVESTAKKFKINDEKLVESSAMETTEVDATVLPVKSKPSDENPECAVKILEGILKAAEPKVEDTKNSDKENASDVREQKDGDNKDAKDLPSSQKVENSESDLGKVIKEQETTSNTATSKDNTSSDNTSSSDSSSSDSSSSSGDSSSSDSAPKEMTQDEIHKIILVCLNSLEDCVSRLPQHYKALYRLAHFYFYYKKEKNIGKCREFMLGNFVSNNGLKLQGLFCERKNSNFFNSIWRIPASEVDRPGSFATHMSRCVLITMEILKESDDYKTLLELALHLQKSPEADKKYLRESERIELFQQALSLCTRSIKEKIGKFHKVDDLSSTTPEKQEVANFMLDLYRIYQRVQKSLPTKIQAFSALLIDCYKIYTGKIDSDNLLDKSIKKCQSIIVAKRQQAQQAAQPPLAPPATAPKNDASTTIAASHTSQTSNSHQPVAIAPPPKKSKPVVPIIPATSFLPHVDSPMPYPKIVNPFLSYLPMMDSNLMSALSTYDQATAAFYLSNLNNFANLPSTAFTQDFIRQMMTSPVESTQSQNASKTNSPTILSKHSFSKTASSNSLSQSVTSHKSGDQPNQGPSRESVSSHCTKVTQQSQNTKDKMLLQSSNVNKTTASITKSTEVETVKSSVPSPQISTNIKTDCAKSTHHSTLSTITNDKSLTLQSTSEMYTSGKLVHQSNSGVNTSGKSTHQSTSGKNTSSKSAHHSTTVMNTSDKPTHQLISGMNASGKSIHHSTSGMNTSDKSTHQSISSMNASGKSAHHSTSGMKISDKSTHQSISSMNASGKSAHHSTSGMNTSDKSTHQSTSGMNTSDKSTHQSISGMNTSSKSAHHSTTGMNTSDKPTHQLISGMNASGKLIHHSTSGMNTSDKSTHQSISSMNASDKSTHQSISGMNASSKHQSSSNTNTGVRSAHQSSNAITSSKSTHNLSSCTNINVKQSHQTSPSVTNVAKYHHSSNSGNKTIQQSSSSNSNKKSTHQTSLHQSPSSSNVNTVKLAHHSSGSYTKSSHQSSTASGNLKSSKGPDHLKTSHQSPNVNNSSIKQTHHESLSGHSKSSHHSLSNPSNSKHSYHQSSTSSSGQVKLTNMSSPSSNSNMHSKALPASHQGGSPGKTLQEKLAERQKHNPAISKSINEQRPLEESSLARLPPSLTITKTGSSSKASTHSIGSNRSNITKNITNPKPGSQSQPKGLLDTSEVIVLDDD